MLKTTACTLLITISLVGCASKEPKPDVWPQIATIQFIDTTPELMLRNSQRGEVAEMLTEALGDHGYKICTDCQADAMATLRIGAYRYMDLTRHRMMTPTTSQHAVVKWSLKIERNGEVIYKTKQYHKRQDTLKGLLARQVLNVMKQIPRHAN